MQVKIWKKENNTGKTDLRHRVCDTAGTPKSEVSEMCNVSCLQSFSLMGWVTLSFHCSMLWAEASPDVFCLCIFEPHWKQSSSWSSGSDFYFVLFCFYFSKWFQIYKNFSSKNRKEKNYTLFFSLILVFVCTNVYLLAVLYIYTCK